MILLTIYIVDNRNTMKINLGKFFGLIWEVLEGVKSIALTYWFAYTEDSLDIVLDYHVPEILNTILLRTLRRNYQAKRLIRLCLFLFFMEGGLYVTGIEIAILTDVVKHLSALLARVSAILGVLR